MFTSCEDDTEETVDTDDEDDTGIVDNSDYTVGVIYKTDDCYDGYTLLYPLRSTTTYLIDNDGELVQSWSSDYTPQAAYLLENGNLLHTGSLTAENSEFDEGGGETGRVEMIDSDDEVVWYYEVNTDTTFMHHDVEYIDTPSKCFAFRCNRYGTDYAGLDYYDLTSQGTLESY